MKTPKPNTQPGLVKNILWLVLSRFGTQGLAVLFTVILARRLGSAAFGEYAFIAAAIFLGNALTTFGTDMLLIREIAGRDDLSDLAPALAIQLALSGVFIALTWAAAPLLPNQSPASVLGLQIYSLALLPLAFFSVFTTALRGKQRMDAYMVLNLGVSALQLAGVWVLVRPGGSVVRLAELLLVVQCAGAGLGGMLCAAKISGFWSGWHFSWHKTAALVRLSAPIALIALIGILYQKISVYMVSTLVGPAPTGWFSAALRVIEASKTVHMAVFTALYPAMAQASKAGPPAALAVRSGRNPGKAPLSNPGGCLLAGAGAASLAILIFAGPLTRFLYGPEYAPAAAGLRVLGLILIPFTANTFFSLAIFADHKEQTVMRVQLAGLVTLVGLNAWWIPRWGVAGACLAFVLAETAQVLLYLLPGGSFARKVRARWLDAAGLRPRNPESSGDQARSRGPI